MIPNRDGARMTPTVVAVTSEGRRLVGQAAEAQAATNPKGTIFDIPRLLGRRFDSIEIQQAKRKLPYQIVEAENGDAHIRIGERVFSPPELCALVLSELRTFAQADLGEPVEEAVATVPSSFNDNQRRAAKDAAAIAGLRVSRILNASSAAALASSLTLDKTGPYVVCDFGGGVLDIAVAELHDNACQVLATGGDSYLGGHDIDQVLIDWLTKKLREDHGIDPNKDGGSYSLLRQAVEKAKRELSSADEATISLALGPGVRTVLTRSEYEMQIGFLLDRMLEPGRRVLKDSGLIGNDINKVILVGGQAHTRKVSTVAANAFSAEVVHGDHPEECVAMGAAIQAGIMEGDITDRILLEVTPHSLGLETQGGAFAPLIERGSAIPTRKGRIFTTVFDNQQWVELHVLQGESDKSEFNVSLGKFKLTDIPPNPKGVPQIEVSFEIDLDGIAQVSALDQATGREQNVIVRAESGLSLAEVKRLRQEFEARPHEPPTSLERPSQEQSPAPSAPEQQPTQELPSGQTTSEHPPVQEQQPPSREPTPQQQPPQKKPAKHEDLRGEIQMLTLGVRHALGALMPLLDDQEQTDIMFALDDAKQVLDGESDELAASFASLAAAADTLSKARQRKQ